MSDIWVGIYPGAEGGTYDVRLNGPGGWFTIVAHVTLSQATSTALQLARTAGCRWENYAHSPEPTP